MAKAQFYRDWNTRWGNWSDAANWNPNAVPGWATTARIGNLPEAHTATVTLDADAGILGLQISNGMKLASDGHQITTISNTWITGQTTQKSELHLQHSLFESFGDIINESNLRMTSSQINVSGRLTNGTEAFLYGGGTVNLQETSGVSLRNNGTIQSYLQPFMTINQMESGLMDLDGSTGNGILRARGVGAQETLTFNGTQLSDSFSGTIELRSGNVLNMNFSDGWTADANSEINLIGRANAPSPSRIQGGSISLNGSLNALTDSYYGEGSHRIEAGTIIGNTADIFIESDNSLQFDAGVTIHGGTFQLEQDASLSFASNTFVQGGDFHTHNQLSSDGSVNFNGLTAWDGNVSINGIARQNGNAVVVGTTTIQAGVFDMDGNGNTNWNVVAPLVIAADGVDSTISNSFDGTINIVGGGHRYLSISLDGPNEHWTMAGQLNLGNSQPIVDTRIGGGSTMRLTGDINVDGQVAMSSDLVVDNPGTIAFANSESRLVARGTTLVKAGATFVGDGYLANGNLSVMTLADGVSLSNVKLENHGQLEIGSSPGIADVAQFENMNNATILFEIGGHAMGDEFDALLVGQGPAILDGMISVDLIDAGAGLFLPEIGDEFTVITALDGVMGTFDNSPVSFADGQGYEWDVLYNPHDVTLRLANISVPEPTAFAVCLVMVVSLAMLPNRRRQVQRSGHNAR